MSSSSTPPCGPLGRRLAVAGFLRVVVGIFEPVKSNSLSRKRRCLERNFVVGEAAGGAGGGAVVVVRFLVGLLLCITAAGSGPRGATAAAASAAFAAAAKHLHLVGDDAELTAL